MSSTKFEYSEAFAQEMDARDPLKEFKDQFYFPEVNGKRALYFCGNSLGLQPKTVQGYIQKELDNWAQKGVNGLSLIHI